MKKLLKKASRWLGVIGLGLGLVANTTTAYGQEFTPGSWQANADGYGGEVSVNVTLTEDKIESIEVDAPDETPGIGDEAISKLVDEVLAKQSLNVEVVSGATGSSEGFLAALTAALEEAGVDVDQLKTKEADQGDQENGDTIEAQETDVIVIGGGGAGLASAVSAHQNGAKVILVEKMPRLGGNTIISGAAYNAADQERQANLEMTDLEKQTVEDIINEEQDDELVKEWQATLAEEWEEYKNSDQTQLFDSPSLHKLQTYNGGDKIADPELIDQLGDQAYESIEWLEDLGMEFNDYIFTVLGGLWSRAHQPAKPLGTGYIETLEQYFQDNSDDMQYYLNTQATDLIVEDDAVVGVVVEQNGEKVELRANNGVIIATGGFGANVEMREEYNQNWPSLENIKTTNQVGATGDGIELGQQASANLVGMEHIQLLPMGDPETGSLSGNIEQGVQDRIFVNKDGERFVNEGERRDVMTEALFQQEDSFMWTIVDKHSYPSGDTTNNFDETIDELVEAGRAFKGDSLEELAEQIGVDPETLQKTVDEFNQAVAGEIEDPFGRTLFDNPIDTAPFYAAPRMPTVHHTMGGLEINEDAQVINKDGQAIKGLFAAGEVTGGIHGSNRLGGNALTDIIVYGRIAGASAAGAN